MNVHNERLKCVYEKVSCRNTQIDELANIVQTEAALPYSIVVYGPASTAKTSAVTLLLEYLDTNFILVNCAECESSKLLYQLILDELAGRTSISPNDKSPLISRADNANDFVHRLKELIVQLPNINQKPLYLVLDNAESLLKLPGNIIALFLRLQELSESNVNVFFISSIGAEAIIALCDRIKTYWIHFPEYSKEETVKVLQKQCPSDCSQEVYLNYLNLVLSVFYSVCRSLREIRYVVRKNFSKYMEPISNGEISESDVAKLWRNIEPHLKADLHQVYLRGNSDCPTDEKWHFELPFYSKYLLIAAYLASYNPSKMDKQFFLKKHDKINKKAKLRKQIKKPIIYHLLGPKAFPLERLVAIFCSIVDDENASSFPILSQVSSLVSLNFLQRLGNSDSFETPKFKCLVSLDAIRYIARSVSFSINCYLHDFT